MATNETLLTELCDGHVKREERARKQRKQVKQDSTVQQSAGQESRTSRVSKRLAENVAPRALQRKGL